MIKALSRILRYMAAALAVAPVAALAQEMPEMAAMTDPNLETAITIGYYLSVGGFLIASVVTFIAVRKFGVSTLGSIFTYLFIGTATFFLITIFQTLGADFFGISWASMDVWWHFMFYLAFASYFLGLRQLIGLGSSESGTVMKGAEKAWGLFAIVALAIIFVIPKMAEPFLAQYNASILYSMGVHHFIAFALAATVGYYLLNARAKLGQIGRAIATPMIVSILALAGQHFWELLFESWEMVSVTDEVGEGGEKIFLTIAAIGLTFAAWRLYSFARGK
jgi:hypothetical protein